MFFFTQTVVYWPSGILTLVFCLSALSVSLSFSAVSLSLCLSSTASNLRGGGALTAKAQSWSVTSQNVGIAAPPTEEGRSWPEPMYINFTDEQKNWRQKPFFLCSEQFEDFGLSL